MMYACVSLPRTLVALDQVRADNRRSRGEAEEGAGGEERAGEDAPTPRAGDIRPQGPAG